MKRLLLPLMVAAAFLMFSLAATQRSSAEGCSAVAGGGSAWFSSASAEQDAINHACAQCGQQNCEVVASGGSCAWYGYCSGYAHVNCGDCQVSP